MRFVALAVGFDGTLARDGRYDERCVDALRALAVTGRKLILVTARALRELLEVFPAARVFDYLIAENGAILHHSATRQSQILAQAPSEILVQELARRGIEPLAAGSSIITTSIANEGEVRDALKKLRLDYQLVTNEASLIIAPVDVNKASGVKEALRQLGLSAHNLAVIGDAENDLALFHLAEHSVAVQNADAAIKACADRTTLGAYCDGFLELARGLTEDDLSYAEPKQRIAIGTLDDGGGLSLSPYCDSLLICGPRGSGKSVLCDRLIEQFGTCGYQCCIVSAAGGGASPLDGWAALGDVHEAPRLSEIMVALEHPSRSVLLNLTALAAESRSTFVEALLVQLQALHDRQGRPHVLAVHPAEALIGVSVAADAKRLSEMTRIYVSTEPERLPEQMLTRVQSVVALASTENLPPQCAVAGTMQKLALAASGVEADRSVHAWGRSDRDAGGRLAQATADEADFDNARSPEADSGSLPADELPSLSG